MPDEIEWRVRLVWEQLFERRPIELDDDFFDIGGHSLLAMRLCSLLEQSVGRKLPVEAVFRAPTIAGMACLLRNSGWSASRPALVPLRSEGTGSPLFWLHGVTVGGTLARQLDVPLYYLQSYWEMDALPTHPHVGALAADYLEQMRSVQPRGPYRLAGYCVGGVVAFEMAHQLRAAGEAVALLYLLAPPAVLRDMGPPSRRARVARKIAYVRAEMEGRSPWAATRFLRERLGAHVRAPGRRRAARAGRALTELERQEHVHEFYLRLMRAYRPQSYDGDVVAVVEQADEPARWKAMVPGAAVHVLAGVDHFDILTMPAHVDAWMLPLKARLASPVDSVLRESHSTGGR